MTGVLSPPINMVSILERLWIVKLVVACIGLTTTDFSSNTPGEFQEFQRFLMVFPDTNMKILDCLSEFFQVI